MPSNLNEQIENTITLFLQDLKREVPKLVEQRSPSGFRDTEMAVSAACRKLSDDISSCILKATLSDPEFQAATSVAARFINGQKYRNGGLKEVTIQLLGGGSIQVTVEYVKPDRRGGKRGGKRDGNRGGKRRKVRRGKGGVGIYPALAALGIWFGVTPALAEEVCRQVTDSDSIRAAREALARRNIDLGQKRTLRIFNKVSGRAVEQRNIWLEQVLENNTEIGTALHNKRVVMGTDGGRLRERHPKGGRRRANGHRGYRGPWKEPKLMVIYVIGDNGRIDYEFRPVYDGTLDNSDRIFDMITAYLKALGAGEVQQLIVVGDGAKWIWKRTAELARRIGISPEKMVEVIDWCHAVSVLYEIAKVQKTLSLSKRAKWIKKAKKLLHAGKIDLLVIEINILAKNQGEEEQKEIKSRINYFIRNIKRMQYAKFVEAKIPTGSGAIESAIRRLVNMRMKGNGSFWKKINAEGMLLLRSYLKARRFDDLIQHSFTLAAPWWSPSTSTSTGPMVGLLAEVA